MIRNGYYVVYTKLFLRQLLSALQPPIGQSSSIVSLVTYSGQAQVAIDSRASHSDTLNALLAAVDSLTVSDNTASNLASGLNLTQSLVSQLPNVSSNYQTKVMVCTNNQAQADTAAIDLSSQIISSGIQISGVTLGSQTVSPQLSSIVTQPAVFNLIVASDITQVQSMQSSLQAQFFPRE